MPHERVTKRIRPVRLLAPRPGVWVFDLGQNFAGWARLTAQGEAGTKIVLRYGENVDTNHALNQTTNRGAQATDTLILRGHGQEIYEPRFTYHGFQYVEVTGYPGAPMVDDLEGCVVNTDCRPIGQFECSDELLNHVHHCTLWSQTSDLQGLSVDCPQRDERLGWLADAQVTAEEAMCNLDMAAFYANWLRDIQGEQDPQTHALPQISPRGGFFEHTVDWSSGYVLVTWHYYLNYGDRRILESNYDSIREYVDYLGTLAVDNILPRDTYGDWSCTAQPDWWISKSGWKAGAPEMTSTAYYYYDTTLLAKMAAILGKQADAGHYESRARQIAQAFNRKYFDPQHDVYRGEPFAFQCCQAFPLFFGLVPKPHRPGVLDKLIDDIVNQQHGHLTTGILGTKFLMEALTRDGRADVAYLLATSQGYPSWAGMTRGRTTLSENWDQSGSNNHVMFGSIDAWYYKTLAGIEVDESAPGYERVLVRPYIPASLDRASATIETIKGRVASEWRKTADHKLSMEIEIPANCEALISVPTHRASNVTEGSRPAAKAPGVRLINFDGRTAVFSVGSGRYAFLVQL
jgi:alpha-L-rhamnosidase